MEIRMPNLPVVPQFPVLSVALDPDRVQRVDLWNQLPSDASPAERAYDYIVVTVGRRGLEPEFAVVTRPAHHPDFDLPAEVGAAPAAALWPVALTATLGVDLPRAEAQRLLEDLRSRNPTAWTQDHVELAARDAPTSVPVWSTHWEKGMIAAGHFADGTFAIADRKSKRDPATITLTVVDPDELRVITEPSPETTR